MGKSSPKIKVFGVYLISFHFTPECHRVLWLSDVLYSVSHGTDTVSLRDTHLPESERVGAVAAAVETVLAQVVLLALGAPAHAHARKTKLLGCFGVKNSGQNFLGTRRMHRGPSQCLTLC